jgi:hypothetical protein
MTQEHAKPMASRTPKLCRPLFYCPPQSRLAVPVAGNPTRRAAFLDRDGTVVEDVGYLAAPSQLKLLPGAVDGIRLLQEEFLVVVITNQSAVARGLLGEEGLVQIHQALDITHYGKSRTLTIRDGLSPISDPLL